MRLLVKATVVAIATIGTSVAQAGEVEIVDAKARVNAVGAYTFSVTLKHGDTGWDHYANAWDVVTPDGKVLGKRKLLHPHVDEQPFTRSLSGVKIPADVKTVKIRAYDKVHGLSDATYEIKLPDRKAEVQPDPETTDVIAPKKPVAVKRKVVKRKIVKKRKAVSKRRVVRKKRIVRKRKVVRKRIVAKKSRVIRKRAKVVRKKRAPRRRAVRRSVSRGSF